MKKLSVIFKTFTVLSLLLSVSILANEGEVKKTVNDYIDGIKKKDTSALEKIIYETATFCAVNKISNKQDDMDSKTYVKYVKMGRIGGWGKTINIQSVKVEEEFATAYVIVENDKLVQKELLTLLKVKGNWMIVNSLYSIAKK